MTKRECIYCQLTDANAEVERKRQACYDFRVRKVAAERERDEARAEVARLERLRDFDTGTTPLPKGLMLEYTRLDEMWQRLVRERDEARQENESLRKLLYDAQARLVGRG